MFYFLYILQNTHTYTDTTTVEIRTHIFKYIYAYPDTFKCIRLHNFMEQANWRSSRRRSSGEWAELPARQWIVIYCCHRILFCSCSYCCCCSCYCIWHSQSEVKWNFALQALLRIWNALAMSVTVLRIQMCCVWECACVCDCFPYARTCLRL